MSTTKNGIYYPNDYESVADIPADMKKLAESVDTKISENKTEIENIKKEQITQNTNISSLEKDNTTNKQDITNIKAKDTEQDKYIAELEAENTRLRQDLNGLPKGQASGESIDLNDSAEMRCELKISGNSKQETREGRNLYNANAENVNISSGVTIEDDWITINNDNTEGTSYKSVSLYKMPSQEIKTSTNYWLVLEVKSISGEANSFELCGNYAPNTSVTGQFSTNIKPTFSNLEAEKTYVYEVTTRDTFENSGIFIRTLLQTAAGKSCSIKFRLSLLEQEVTSDTFKYEQYGAMPSPDYPSEVECCGDNINLFDKDNANILNAYINGTTKQFASTENARTLYISCKPNKTYTIKKVTSARFGVGTCSAIPTNGLTCTNAKVPNTGTEISIDSGSEDKYLCVFYYLSTADTLTEKEILNSIKIVEGTEVGGYSPYGQGCINEVICNKNILPYVEKVNYNIETGVDYYGITYMQKVKSNTSYILSTIDKLKSGFQLREYDKEGNVIQTTSKTLGTTFTTNSKTQYIKFRTNDLVSKITNPNFMLEESKTLSDYIEHKSQTYTIPTQQPFRAIGDTRDTFIKKNNKWYERHYIARKIFDGTENWARHTNGCFHSLENLLANALMPTSNTVAALSTCTHFITDSYDNTWKNNVNNTIALASNGTNNPRVRADDFATVDDFKSMLSEQYNAGTPVYVDYVLEEPLDIECTEEQSTILFDIEQNAKTYDKVTHMYSTDKISSYKEVTYKIDLDSRLNNIEQAILSQGGNI